MNLDKTKYLVIPLDSVPSSEALLEAAKRLRKDKEVLLKMCNLKPLGVKCYNDVLNFLEYITKISGKLVITGNADVAVSAGTAEVTNVREGCNL